MKPRRPDVTTRMSLALLSRLFDLADFVSRSTPRNTHPLASGGLSGAVALEVPARTSGNLGRTAPAHPTHGRPRMRSGARSASLTSCCSSSGLGSRRGRSGSTCSNGHPAGRAAISAGRRFYAITLTSTQSPWDRMIGYLRSTPLLVRMVDGNYLGRLTGRGKIGLVVPISLLCVGNSLFGSPMSERRREERPTRARRTRGPESRARKFPANIAVSREFALERGSLETSCSARPPRVRWIAGSRKPTACCGSSAATALDRNPAAAARHGRLRRRRARRPAVPRAARDSHRAPAHRPVGVRRAQHSRAALDRLRVARPHRGRPRAPVTPAGSLRRHHRWIGRLPEELAEVYDPWLLPRPAPARGEHRARLRAWRHRPGRRERRDRSPPSARVDE